MYPCLQYRIREVWGIISICSGRPFSPVCSFFNTEQKGCAAVLESVKENFRHTVFIRVWDRYVLSEDDIPRDIVHGIGIIAIMAVHLFHVPAEFRKGELGDKRSSGYRTQSCPCENILLLLCEIGHEQRPLYGRVAIFEEVDISEDINRIRSGGSGYPTGKKLSGHHQNDPKRRKQQG